MDYKTIKQHNKKLKEPFKKVNFTEEGHKYWITGDPTPIKSVSSLLKHLYEEFDTDNIAPKWAAERGLEVDDVKLAWEGEGTISTTHGSKVHLIGEDYVRWKFLQECERPIPIDKQSLGAIQFINDLPDYLIPVATELQMYSPTHWYTGTCDGILYNTKTGKYIIYDYKTNKALTDAYKKGPLFHINPDYGLIQDNMGKYSAQFSFYQILLEEAGFEVGGRVLVWLNEDKKAKKLYKTIQTKNITSDLKELLKLKLHLK
jgi:hypothetical protein